MLSQYGDEMVAVLVGIPVTFITESSGTKQCCTPNLNDEQGTGTTGKRRRSENKEHEW